MAVLPVRSRKVKWTLCFLQSLLLFETTTAAQSILHGSEGGADATTHRIPPQEFIRFIDFAISRDCTMHTLCLSIWRCISRKYPI
ncbi:hypothetical protein BKA67DRAFT_567481 [Truncatella angustata]|uniref:Secreted protein n=1 Tax=Truncatella angustata TaxID=152316 RepID=A0A9P8UII6_9PEZI|nr:uncharacterized protein BKA67DRAFT_567481 [Truncatella angustata]KAH6652761.1 hypothetical protein BKA67DRAFT_567481 [Truncatella angustata]